MSRDVLAPPILTMSNNRHYRVNVVHDDFGGGKWNSNNRNQVQQKIYEEPDLYCDDENEDDEAFSKIEQTPDGGFVLSVHVAKYFYGGLIGSKGSTKRRIEEETRSEIVVPRQNESSNKLVIKGKERSHVCAALRKIRLIVMSLRKRMKPTHFLAVALNTGQVLDNFLELKKSILEAQIPGIDESLFISERCIHLTLGVYVLLDDAERQKAVEHLKTCNQFLANLKTPFEVKIKGLEIMNDDPSSTRVLYGGVEAPELQNFADRCLEHFKPTGLCASDDIHRESVKLHMTLLRNKYRKRIDSKSPDSFDARAILKRFGDYDFGSAQCEAVHLCVLGSSDDKDLADFYKITGSLVF